MPAFNPYSVLDSFDGNLFGGGIGAKRPMRQLPVPTGKQPTNPYSFTGQDQYGTFQGGGDMPKPPIDYMGQDLTGRTNQRQPLAPSYGREEVNPIAWAGLLPGGPPIFDPNIPGSPKPELGGFTPSDQTNPYAAPNANQMHIMSANNVGVQNPTQSVANNPYASMFPTFNANDLSWQFNNMAIGEGGNERMSALPTLGTLGNVRNYFPEWDQLNPNNYMFTQLDPNNMELMVKTAAKEGTVVPYSLQNGQWTPNYEGRRTQAWDTGNSFQNRALAMIAGGALASPYITQMVGGMGAAAPAVGGTVGQGLPASLGGIEGIIGGSTAAPSLSAGLGTGFAGTAPITGTLPSIVPGALTGAGAAGIGMAPSLSSIFPSVGSGLGPTVEAAAGLGGLEGGAAAGLGGQGLGSGSGAFVGEGAASGIPAWDSAAGGGSLLDRLSGLGSRVGNLGSSVGRLLGGAGGAGGRAGGVGGGGGLAGLIAALYGSNAQENYADQLNQFIQEMRSNANPYMTRLQESYTNPQAYLESPEMQARLGIEANKLTGIDASKGRLSNDIQRTKLLQDYGMSALNDYRTGLRNTVQNLWNPNQVFQAQALMGAADAAKYSDLARLLGQGTQGGFSVGNTVNDIKSIIDAGGDLWDFIKDWF